MSAPETTAPQWTVSPVRLLSDALAWMDAIAARVVGDLEREGFELTPESRVGVPAVVHGVIEAVLHVARQDAVSVPEGCEDLGGTCRRHRLSRPLAVRTVQLAADDAWRTLVASVGGDERQRLLDAVDRLGRLVDALRQVVLLAYVGDRLAPVDAPVARRVAAPLYRHGAGGHAVVAMPRPQLREVELMRSRVGARGTVFEIDDVAVALLPARGSSGPAGDDPLAAAREVVDGLGVEASAGLALAPAGGQLSAAVAEACEILWVVLAPGYEPRPYQAEEVVLEILLLRSPDIARRMARHLMPLKASNPELLDTLEEVLEATGKRDATARKLCIHPNTLAYRLRKIAELTSLRVTQRPRDQWLARVALTSMNILGRLDEPARVD